MDILHGRGFDFFISPTDTFFSPVRDDNSPFFAVSLGIFDLGVVLANDADDDAIFNDDKFKR